MTASERHLLKAPLFGLTELERLTECWLLVGRGHVPVVAPDEAVLERLPLEPEEVPEGYCRTCIFLASIRLRNPMGVWEFDDLDYVVQEDRRPWMRSILALIAAHHDEFAERVSAELALEAMREASKETAVSYLRYLVHLVTKPWGIELVGTFSGARRRIPWLRFATETAAHAWCDRHNLERSAGTRWEVVRR